MCIKNDHETRVGYIPKDTAAKIQKDVISKNVLCIVSEITGGYDKKENYGCNIEIRVVRNDEQETPNDVVPMPKRCVGY